jgi:ABC-type phosphate/phosphonate transport system substrate-binding protein
MKPFLAVVTAVIVTGVGLAQPAPDPVHIGIALSLFDDTAEKTINEMSKSFNDLVKELTGMNGKVHSKDDAFAIAKKMEEKTYHLGVFQGFEYAWVKQKHPEFKPLMNAIYYDKTVQAHIVVNKDSGIKDLADLKGKDFAIGSGTKGHAKLFLERQLAKLGGDTKTFFAKTTKPDSIEAALDQVAGKEVNGAIVDAVSLKTYQSIKPGVFKRLVKIKDSEIFPSTVVAYREGVLSKETLDKFREGMLKAETTASGREQMRVFKVTAFENVHADLEKNAAAILKAYPPPEKK